MKNWHQRAQTPNLTEQLVHLAVRTQKLALHARLRTVRQLVAMQLPALQAQPDGPLRIRQLNQKLTELEQHLRAGAPHDH